MIVRRFKMARGKLVSSNKASNAEVPVSGFLDGTRDAGFPPMPSRGMSLSFCGNCDSSRPSSNVGGFE